MMTPFLFLLLLRRTPRKTSSKNALKSHFSSIFSNQELLVLIYFAAIYLHYTLSAVPITGAVPLIKYLFKYPV